MIFGPLCQLTSANPDNPKHSCTKGRNVTLVPEVQDIYFLPDLLLNKSEIIFFTTYIFADYFFGLHLTIDS